MSVGIGSRTNRHERLKVTQEPYKTLAVSLGREVTCRRRPPHRPSHMRHHSLVKSMTESATPNQRILTAFIT
jgi:hypothetical protein